MRAGGINQWFPKGEVVIPMKFERIGGFSANGLSWIEENEKWGYINTQGEIVIPPRFELAFHFYANGWALVYEE